MNVTINSRMVLVKFVTLGEYECELFVLVRLVRRALAVHTAMMRVYLDDPTDGAVMHAVEALRANNLIQPVEDGMGRSYVLDVMRMAKLLETLTVLCKQPDAITYVVK